MARSLWKGAIAFGLVNIPVELYTVVRDHRPRFRLLHADDRSPIRLERVCEREGRPVAWDDLVKGYEVEKGRFVTLTKDDFKAAALEKNRTIDIVDFVKAEEIDDRFFETPYYVLPGKGGERAYALLREAIKRSGRTGIAKVVIREKQHLAALGVIGGALVLTMMRFADELADLSEFTFPTARDVRKGELEIARTLVENLASPWQPEKYTDEYRENLMQVIRAKVKRRPAKLQAEEPPRGAEVVDLMERLRQSLEARRPRGRTPARRAKAQRASGRKKTRRRAA